MGWNNLIDVCNVGKINGQPKKKDYIGVGMSVNHYQNAIDTSLEFERNKIEQCFQYYLRRDKGDDYFSCSVEQQATYSMVDRYYAKRRHVKIDDTQFGVKYDNGLERVCVCAKLSKILTWRTLGYNPKFYMNDQVKDAYEAIRNVLDCYKKDPNSLVELTLPEGVEKQLEKLLNEIEFDFNDIIFPKKVELDKPISTFFDQKFAGFYNGTDHRQIQTTQDGRRITVKNGFILDDGSQDDDMYMDQNLGDGRWE